MSPDKEVRPVTLQRRVNELVRQHGGLRPAARAVQIDSAYLYRLQTGEKVSPGDFILRRLGLRSVTLYLPITGGAPATKAPKP